MSIEINMPEISEDEVQVTEILVSIGEKVEAEQSIITVEGDKASIEIPSPEAGIIKDLKVSVGDKITTGKLIMILENHIEDPKNITDNKIHKDSFTHDTNDAQLKFNNISKSTAVHLPDIGRDQVEVTAVLVKVGDKVTAEQSLIIVEGDKTSIEIPAPFSGNIKDIKVKAHDRVSTGSIIMIIDISDDNNHLSIDNCNNAKINPQSSLELSDSNNEQLVKKQFHAPHATPVIRRIAHEFNIDLSKVNATGRKGRILREDIGSYIQDLVKRAENLSNIDTCQSHPEAVLPWPKVDFNKFGQTEAVKLGRIQKISGDNLHRNWMMIPHVTQFDNADITDLEDFRKQQNILNEKNKSNIKITLLVFIIKAVAKVIQKLPHFNSSISEDGNAIIVKKYINIGVAVDTPNGIFVPVLTEVHQKSIMELTREITDLSQKARAGKLLLSDMQGGGFTISSLGNIGGTAFTPIINAPEVAILGVSRSSIKPVWNGKEFLPRLILPLSLSYDHRVVDGADGARFLRKISTIISDIRLLVM